MASIHHLQSAVTNAFMDNTGRMWKTPKGYLRGWGTTVGNGYTNGWAPGAVFQDTNASAGAQLWVNEGTKATATWVGIKRTAGVDITMVDGANLNFGTGSDHIFTSDGTILSLSTVRNVDFDEGLPERFALEWVAGRRGKPGINADIQDSSESTRMVTDPDFEILGGSATSDDVTYDAEGGITFTTDGSDGEGVILLPHLDANQSAWTQVTWGTDRTVKWECDIRSGAAITNSIIWCGLKLTNTDVIATDADQVFFRYEDGVNSGKWQAVYSIGDSDTSVDTGIVAVQNTRIHFAIRISLTRIATMYMDGVLVATSTALTNTVDLIPYIAVEADGAEEAKTLNVYSQRISRLIS